MMAGGERVSDGDLSACPPPVLVRRREQSEIQKEHRRYTHRENERIGDTKRMRRRFEERKI